MSTMRTVLLLLVNKKLTDRCPARRIGEIARHRRLWEDRGWTQERPQPAAENQDVQKMR